MHGRAWVETAPSGGARFVVSIPRDDARIGE
jgi:signal transduction histidine kinase